MNIANTSPLLCIPPRDRQPKFFFNNLLAEIDTGVGITDAAKLVRSS